MPSASAVSEKNASTEAQEPIKNALNVIEKKVRNLEKRKQKLDQYKSDEENGKELIEDQKNAVKKYDQVVEFLEFARDFQKQFIQLLQDSAKGHKRAAKREQSERQQQEMQRLREILLIQDILTNFGPDVREDFLKGSGKAVKLTEENLDHLDELYKLVLPDRNNKDGSFDDQLAQAAEHLIALVEGRNKEVLGTTYKELKSLCMKISNSGYFDANKETIGNASEDNLGDQTAEVVKPIGDYNSEVHEVISTNSRTIESLEVEKPTEQTGIDNSYYPSSVKGTPPNTYVSQTRPISDLSTQPNLNFLQESQIDLESPHMDPAVVVAHPMAPQPSNLAFHHSQYSKSQSSLGSGITPQQAVEVTGASHQTLANHSTVAQQFDENGSKIPTQTFTNQNFTTIQSMMQSGAISTNYGPISTMSEQSLSTGRSINHDIMGQNLLKPQYEQSDEVSNTNSSFQTFSTEDQATFQSTQQDSSGGFSRNNNRGGPRNRGGTSNGYSRGNRNFGDSGNRGANFGYQSNYNSNSNYNTWRGGRGTGNPRGGRGTGMRGGNGTRGSYQNQ